jgi:acetolactate synthase regulatory subunit
MKNVKKTFHLRETVLERFLRVQEHLGYRVKDALEEALSDWVEKNQSKKK